MEFFDNHAHLDDEKFNDDREQLIKQIYQDGITKFITAGYNIESSQKAIEIAKKYDFIYCTAGISPNDIPQTEEELWKMLEQIQEMATKNRINKSNNENQCQNIQGNQYENEKLENSEKQCEIKNKKLVAIGEIGLDYYWNSENKEMQKLAFIEQIKIANKLELPIVIHTRKASQDTLQIIEQNQSIKSGVIHCCSLKGEELKRAIKLGFYISFAGPITFKNAKNIDEIVGMVPNDKILIETDSPYLSPEPQRGKRNDPRCVKYVAQKIAEVKKMTLDEIANITYQNAERIFGIS